MKIKDILKIKHPAISFEFFPPKSPENENILYETMDSLKGMNPDYASVTFGALGTTSDKSLEYAIEVTKHLDTSVMMHLTCVGFDNDTVDNILSELKENNIENILALRGDIPADKVDLVKSRKFQYASDLVTYIKSKNEDAFCIGGACYPEKHPESLSIDNDIENLKIKVDTGIDFLVTQLFFDNDTFYRFRDRIAKEGINLPIVAGIMPITNYKQIVRFTDMCCTSIPQKVIDRIDGRSDEETAKVGIDIAVEQSNNLIKNGVDGLHYYTLNKSVSTLKILERLKY